MSRTGKFKVDYTGSSWGYDTFAVYEQRRFWRFTWWSKVHEAGSVKDARRFADEASQLPVFRG